METLNLENLHEVDGGWIKEALKIIGLAASYIIGEDIYDVWDEGWDDPYGKD